MAVNFEPSPPCLVTTARALRAAAAQLEAAAQRLDAFASDRALAQVVEARRLASIARNITHQATCDTVALAAHELASVDLASA